MTRDTEVEKLLFKVRLQEVYHYVPEQDTLPGFLDPPQSDLRPIHGFKAITKMEDGSVFSVVTDEYRLVTNEEALNLGKQCLRQLFNSIDESRMEVFNIVAPKSLSFCHIDMVNSGYAMNIWAKETWIPYLRVTNSYNRTRALRFDLGFCRKLCDNGVIYERQTIPYKFAHTRQDIAPEGIFSVDGKKLRGVEENFRNTLETLNAYPVPRDAFMPLACDALGLSFDIESTDTAIHLREARRLEKFKESSHPLVEKYVGELRENAYAVFNLVTDLASRPVFYPAPTLMVDTLQKRAGAWLGRFLREIRQGNFSLERYLEKTNHWFSLN